ncbi:MAG TPA: restriction endonuclease [Thermoanaerobaculia bacterium]|nr:restriction endonuclease [Thermoanaerobaculia bacterium]
MKKFESDSREIPIDPLVQYIARGQELIHSIHPAKLEELVGAIYSEILGYKVESCSYARPDKGIDLIVVHAIEGRTLAIQVKRHRSPIELGMIHQFFGAMVDNERKEGVFVTSGRFRSGALATADSLRRKTGIRIDLVDGRRLLEFIGIMNVGRQRPRASDFGFWMSHPYFGKR